MLIPDIPLPDSYEQKCVACGAMNRINDTVIDVSNTPEAQETHPEPNKSDYDFDQSLDFGETPQTPTPTRTPIPSQAKPVPPQGVDREALRDMEQRLRMEFEEKLQRLEDKVRQWHAEKPENPVTPLPPEKQTETRHPLLLSPISEKDGLIATTQETLASKVASLLQPQGYQFTVADTAETFVQELQEVAYELVILDHRLLQTSAVARQGLTLVRNIAIGIRRQQQFVLLSPTIPTGETQTFFQWGLDLNVHYSDLDGLPELLKAVTLHKAELFSQFRGLEVRKVEG
jgi:CheY-like chemotaxis protein